MLGSTFFVYAVTEHIEVAMAATALAGMVDGYLIVVLISWLQARVHESLVGRVMSVITPKATGSAAIWGVLVPISCTKDPVTKNRSM